VRLPITTVSSRAFNQDSGRAKRAALAGPVFITDRGKPSHVLLSIADYRKLIRVPTSIVDMLAMPDMAGIDFTPPRLGEEPFPSADPPEPAELA
jgi:Antitoxin Phd_YefM, type II toxin-antitoxin system